MSGTFDYTCGCDFRLSQDHLRRNVLIITLQLACYSCLFKNIYCLFNLKKIEVKQINTNDKEFKVNNSSFALFVSSYPSCNDLVSRCIIFGLMQTVYSKIKCSL